MDLTVHTNNVPRDVLYWHELTEKERKEFDYLDTEDRQDGATFFRYRGSVYDLGEFTSIPQQMELGKWDGYISQGFFFGLVVRYAEDYERVVIGNYVS